MLSECQAFYREVGELAEEEEERGKSTNSHSVLPGTKGRGVDEGGMTLGW